MRDQLSFESQQAKSPAIEKIAGLLIGAGEMNRTPDLLITNVLKWSETDFAALLEATKSTG